MTLELPVQAPLLEREPVPERQVEQMLSFRLSVLLHPWSIAPQVSENTPPQER
jgi:hypothetical protein